MSKQPTADEQISEYAKQYHEGKISQSEFYKLSKQVKKPARESFRELWQASKYLIIVVIAIVLILILGGGLYRVNTGGDFIPNNSETEQERQSRLVRCADVWGKTPTGQEQQDPELKGVCSGFTEAEIEAVRLE